MGLSVFPVASAATTTRFPAAIGNPFNIPSGLTLQNTITSSTSYSAGTFPAQVWVVIIGGGGGGAKGGSSPSATSGGGGGGGGACIGWVDVPSSGTLYVVIGAGGAGSANGAASMTPGGKGGNSRFGNYMAYGGGGGATNDGYPSYLSQTAIPVGPGAGAGAVYYKSIAAGVNSNIWFPAGVAPYTNTQSVNSMAGNTAQHFINTNASSAISFPGSGSWTSENYNNFTGGGAAYHLRDNNGGDGLTGSGCMGSNGTSIRGGNSSRDGGSTFTFTGGTTTNQNGAGGAGFLANANYEIGGSGGGGGGGMYSSNGGGAGGAGCVLVYY